MQVYGIPRGRVTAGGSLAAIVMNARRYSSSALTFVAAVLSGIGLLTADLYTLSLGPRPLLVVAIAIANGALLVILLQRRRLELELRRAQARSVVARDEARREIQRDLHDGAQQRLVSVRIRMDQLAESLAASSEGAAVERLGMDIGAALDEIRDVAHGNDPSPLIRRGIPTSLRELAATAPIPVSVEIDRVGRYDAGVERNVYLCIAEALQNAAKHAGGSATARVRVQHRRDRLVFEIEDSGVGFDPERAPRGDGLGNISDRVAMLGGELIVDSRPGAGTRIQGTIPVAPASAPARSRNPRDPGASRRPRVGRWITSGRPRSRRAIGAGS